MPDALCLPPPVSIEMPRPNSLPCPWKRRSRHHALAPTLCCVSVRAFLRCLGLHTAACLSPPPSLHRPLQAYFAGASGGAGAGWLIENSGVAPDIEVHIAPHDAKVSRSQITVPTHRTERLPRWALSAMLLQTNARRKNHQAPAAAPPPAFTANRWPAIRSSNERCRKRYGSWRSDRATPLTRKPPTPPWQTARPVV